MKPDKKIKYRNLISKINVGTKQRKLKAHHD